ncbi:MAG: PDDEXK nuclease domain-containing protein [Gammaproteobacteria bacterium]|nr:PDDEXK nuclease domain-containing protein [Gammaproteobacteria bacterium]
MQEVLDLEGYKKFLLEVKSKIESARIQATRSVNRNLIELYWSIGKIIVEKQAELKWGDGVVEMLAKDLQHAYNVQGFSRQNLWYMRQLYLEYKDEPILQQVVGELSWSANLLILSRIKGRSAREYYLRQAVEMGWSRNVLLHQIKSEAYERHQLVDKQHSFKETLPEALAEQASDMMKDLYVFNIFEEPKKLLESEIENRMVEKIKTVLLELGYGFSFIGNQYRIAHEKREYFVDLLFHNRKLNCLVALELKAGKFKPEYAGKMNFYLNLLDDFVREPHENPSIGMILCGDRDRFEVEYALRGVDKPIGVADYTLTRKLPKDLMNKLPDPKMLEAEIKKELFLDELEE